jgi:hypothetical protein
LTCNGARVTGILLTLFGQGTTLCDPYEQEMRLTALEGLAAVVNRVTCSAPVPGSTLYVHACHPRGALPAPGLAGCPVGRGE